MHLVTFAPLSSEIEFLELGDQLQKTTVRVEALDPVWSPREQFAFLATPDMIDKAQVIFEIMDYDRYGSPETLITSSGPTHIRLIQTILQCD